MIFSSVLDTQAIDEQQVQSFFSRLTLEKLLYAAVLLVLCAVLIRLILRAADKLFSRSKLDHTIFGFLRTSAKAILIFITIMLVAGTLGVDTTSLLAILSVAGLAVSLSLQTALSNVAGAMMILTAKPFRAGDYVLRFVGHRWQYLFHLLIDQPRMGFPVHAALVTLPCFFGV